MSEKGLEHRSKRAIEPEAVFGQLKSNNKFNRFTIKGLAKTSIEFGLMAIGHNLRKLVKKTKIQEKECDINSLWRFINCAFVKFELLRKEKVVKINFCQIKQPLEKIAA